MFKPINQDFLGSVEAEASYNDDEDKGCANFIRIQRIHFDSPRLSVLLGIFRARAGTIPNVKAAE